jgi:putative heme-binding domain-containing protein
LRSLRGASLTAPERTRVLAAAVDDPESSALIEALGGWKSRPEGSKPEPLPAWLAKLEGPADPAAGARVFFHPKGPGCYRCHQVEGRGGRVGPDLSATGSALTRERLVESIVDPSKEVAPQFVAHAVALRDGRVVTGTFLESTEAGHVYADSQGKLVTVKPSEIEEDRPLPASIMPAELPGLMTTQEFRDLIAFLRSPRGGP